mmetsp:Transcript_5876/g.24563  ORF Transcript_5876/g.24563 Transcript_5876/m.24563 type:complete len:362 (+) Transcript_5876:67-1152(+)
MLPATTTSIVGGPLGATVARTLGPAAAARLPGVLLSGGGRRRLHDSAATRETRRATTPHTTQNQPARRRLSVATPLLARVRSLAECASIEVSPATVDTFIAETEDYEEVDNLLYARRKVFVNMLRREVEHFEAVGRGVRALSERGHVPVPHVPASILADEAQAAWVIENLAVSGAKECLIVGGNTPATSTTLTAAKVADIAAHSMDRVSFAAFPEGHPRAPDGAKQLDAKLDALASKCRVGVVSQWTCNPATTSKWLGDFLRRHPAATVHVGVAGPAGRHKIARFASFCGVPLHPKRSADDDVFHAPSHAAMTLAADLEYYDVPHHQVHLHLFSLNTGRTVDFLRRLTNGDPQAKSNLLAA